MSARDLVFHSGGLRFAGTLTVPAVAPRGAVLLVGGSGPLDRDGNHKRAPLAIQAQLADALDAAGYATFRYDRRGVGASGGDFLSAGFADNIDDAAAAYAAMTAALPDVPRAHLLGHSEGAGIVGAVAARLGDQGPAGVVLFNPYARPGQEVLLWQARRIAETLPRPVRALLRLLRVDLVRKVAANHGKIRASGAPVMRIGGAKVNALWFRQFLDHDPRADLGAVRCPVLAVAAAKDLQSPPEDASVVAASAGGPAKVVVVENLNHILRRQDGPASMRTYKKDLRHPVDPRVPAAVLDWLSGPGGA